MNKSFLVLNWIVLHKYQQILINKTIGFITKNFSLSIKNIKLAITTPKMVLSSATNLMEKYRSTGFYNKKMVNKFPKSGNSWGLAPKSLIIQKIPLSLSEIIWTSPLTIYLKRHLSFLPQDLFF